MKTILQYFMLYLSLFVSMSDIFGQTTYTTSPAAGNYTYTSCSFNDKDCNLYSGSNNNYYEGSTIKMTALSISGNILSLRIRKCDGSAFMNNGHVNFRDEVCDPPSTSYNGGQVNFSAGDTYIDVQFQLNFTSGSVPIVCAMQSGYPPGSVTFLYTTPITIYASTVSTPTCSTPSNPHTNSTTSTSGEVDWDFVSGVSNYTVQYRQSGYSSWTTTTASSSFYNITGLSPNTTYQWRVKANCSNGASSGYTSTNTFITDAAAATCSTPSNPHTNSTTSTSGEVDWDVVSGVSDYTVQYRQSGYSSWTTTTASSSFYNVTGLSSNTTYQWRVKANCTNGASSGYTSTNTFTTDAAVLPFNLQVTSEVISPNSPWTQNVTNKDLQVTVQNTGGQNFNGTIYLSWHHNNSSQTYIADLAQTSGLAAGSSINLSPSPNPSTVISNPGNYLLVVKYTTNNSSYTTIQSWPITVVANAVPCTSSPSVSPISPSNNAQLTIGNNVTFSWSGSSGGSNCFIQSYTFYITTSASQLISNVSNGTGGINNGSSTNLSFTINSPTFAVNTTYYWAIVATNSSGQSTAGVARTFTVVNPTPQTYSISGKVKNGSGVGIAGMGLSFNGQTTTTDNSGNYTFSNILSGTSGTITPTNSGYTYSPSSIPVSSISSNQYNKNFTASVNALSHWDLGGLRFYADNIPTSGNQRTLSGNVRVGLANNSCNHLLEFENNITVYTTGGLLPYFTTTGETYLTNIPNRGKVVIYHDYNSYSFRINDNILEEYGATFKEDAFQMTLAYLPVEFTKLEFNCDNVVLDGYMVLPSILRYTAAHANTLSSAFFGKNSGNHKFSINNVTIHKSLGVFVSGGSWLVTDLRIKEIIELKQFYVSYENITNTFKTQLNIQIPLIKGDLGAGGSIVNGKVNSFNLSYAPVNGFEIGTTGLEITEIGFEAENISAPPPPPLGLKLKAIAMPSPLVDLSNTNWNNFLNFEDMFELELAGTYFPSNGFSINANAKVFQNQAASTNVFFSSTKASFDLDIDLLMLHIYGEVVATRDNGESLLTGGSKTELHKPSYNDWSAQTPEIVKDLVKLLPNINYEASGYTYLNFSNHRYYHAIYLDVPNICLPGFSVGVPPFTIGNYSYNGSSYSVWEEKCIAELFAKAEYRSGQFNFDGGSNLSPLPIEARNFFLNNQGGLISPMLAANFNNGNQVYTFNIDESTPNVLFEIKNNAGGTPSFELIYHEDTITLQNVSNYDIFNDIQINNSKVILSVSKPRIGEYDFVCDINTEVLIYKVEEKPFVKIKQVSQDVNNKNLTIKWVDSYPNGEAEVFIGLDNDMQGGNGIIYASFSENDSLDITILNYDTIPTGQYYPFALIQDSIGQWYYDYFPQSYRLITQNAPAAPSNFTITPTDTSLQLNWVNNDVNPFLDYNIYYSNKSGEITYETHSFLARDTTFIEISLPPGNFYELGVTAIDTLSRESDFSNIASLNWVSNTLNNAPFILTNIKEEVIFVDSMYSKLIQVHELDGDNLTYSLEGGVSGMSFTNGLINWQPTYSQIGLHKVKLRVDDGNNGVDTTWILFNVIPISRKYASIDLNKSHYIDYNDEVIITLKDLDYGGTNAIDTVEAYIYSNGDTVGLHIKLTETAPKSNTFNGVLGFSNIISSNDLLYTNFSDTIYVEYLDEKANTIVRSIAYFDEYTIDFDVFEDSLCSGETTRLINKSYGDGVSYFWNFGDGSFSNEKHPVHEFNCNSYGDGTENFTVILTIHDDREKILVKSKVITVNQLPLLNISDTLSSCDEVTINTQNTSNQVVWDSRDTMVTKIFNQSRYSTVEVTNQHGCISRDTVQVNILNTMELGNVITPILCHGNKTNIDLQISFGTSPFQYSWNTNNTNQDLQNISSDIYSVTVTDANGCQKSDTFSISQPPLLQSTTTNTHNVCFGETKATASVSVVGGVGNYAYHWINSNTTGSTVSNLPAGKHEVHVTDGNGCLRVDSVIVHEPYKLVLTSDDYDATCNGTATGQIYPSLYGGTTPYNWFWADGYPNMIRNTVSAGVYKLMATDGNGCTDSLMIQINEPTPIQVSSVVTHNICPEDQIGAIDLSVSGGAAPYQYYWSNDTTEDINGLSAGIYTVDIVDANLCWVYNWTDTVLAPSEISTTVVKTPTLCYGSADGTAAISAIGGTGLLTYTWSDGAVGQNRSNLAEGTYFVTITDIKGCSKIETISISQPSPIVANYTIQSPSCNGFADGHISANITGGTNSYTLDWNNGSTANVLNNIVAGNYQLTVTDNNNCLFLDTIVLSEPSTLSFNPVVIQPICEYDYNGSIDLNLVGGTIPYNYHWNNSALVGALNNLHSGNYTATVTDAQGCIDSIAFVLQASNPFSAQLSVENTNCALLTGSIAPTIIGGSAPFSYLWNNGDTTSQLNNLGSNVYTVTISDALGCQIVKSASVFAIDTFSVSGQVVSPSCYGQSNGQINISSNDNLPITCIWSDGITLEDRTNLAAGNYSVTVTNSNGCTDVLAVVMNQPAPMGLNYSNNTHACIANSGTLSANVGGGTPPYSYMWTNTSQNTANITTLSPGLYAVTATDANGCSISSNTPIQIYGAPTADFSYTQTDNTVSFVNSSTNEQIISWDFGDGNGSSQPNPIHTYNSSGIYQVTLTIINPCGTVSFSQNISVFQTGVGEQFKACHFIVYPNPNSGLFTIQLECSSSELNYDIEIYNSIGQRVRSFDGLNTYNTNQKVDLTLESNGMYYIHLIDEKRQILQTAKIVKQQ